MSRTTLVKDFKRDMEAYTAGETPSAMDLLRAPIIDDWTTEVHRVGKEFKLVVKGISRQHPHYPEGEAIFTQALAWFDRKGKFVRTAIRLYALGTPAGATDFDGGE
jgi:hypothetical protein